MNDATVAKYHSRAQHGTSTNRDMAVSWRPIPKTRGHVVAVASHVRWSAQKSWTQQGFRSLIWGFFAQAMRLANPANAVPPALGTCVQWATNNASSHWSSLSRSVSACLVKALRRMHTTTRAARRIV